MRSLLNGLSFRPLFRDLKTVIPGQAESSRRSARNDTARYYIDPKTASVVATYSHRNWVSRNLYNGLHSLNFPWLYNYRPLWDIVVIFFMLGGTGLCVTSLVLAWRVLGRKLKHAQATDVLTAKA